VIERLSREKRGYVSSSFARFGTTRHRPPRSGTTATHSAEWPPESAQPATHFPLRETAMLEKPAIRVWRRVVGSSTNVR